MKRKFVIYTTKENAKSFGFTDNGDDTVALSFYMDCIYKTIEGYKKENLSKPIKVTINLTD